MKKSAFLIFTLIYIHFAALELIGKPGNTFLASESEYQSITTTSDTIPFVLKYGRPFVEVYVNDNGPFEFAVDIGASGVGRINMPLYEELALPVVGEQLNSDGVNTKSERTVSVQKLRLGSIVFSDLELIMRDYGAPISGILARGFFANNTLAIDYSKNQLIISKEDLSIEKCMVYETAFRVKGSIGGAATSINFDTGSNLGMVIPKSFLDDNNIAYTETGNSKKGRRANTQFELVEAVLNDEFILDNTTYKGIKFYYATNFNEVVLGGPFFTDKKIVIDQNTKCLKLIKAD